MNTLPTTHRKSAGFTLVEMIGVLAVIAILASLLVPRVFQAIGDSKINNAASTVNSIKSGVSEYYGRYGKIGGAGGTNLTVAVGTPSANWDSTVLLREGFIEKPFSVRIGNGLIGSTAGGSHLQVVNILGNTNSPTALNGGAYNLDGANPANDISGALLVEAVIEGVDPQDAKDFNDRIDGSSLGAALGSDDLLGRVKYDVTTNNTASVRVYIAHK
jgi:prepilin-type N-terminal cleavage/methylation domain-containing protein